MKRVKGFAIAAAGVLMASSAWAQASPLRVICSNGIKGAVDKLKADAERAIGRSIAIQFGASAVLKRTIESGEAFDLAILTPGVIGELVKSGKIAAGSETDLARANLGIGVKSGAAKADISTPAAIKKRLLDAKSVTYAKEGAANAAIESMLAKLGIADQVNAKTVFQGVGGKAEEMVASGADELVFAPVSEIVTVPGVEVLGLFPKEFQNPLIMTAGFSTKAANADAAKAFVKFLTSSAAVPVIQASGMEAIAKK
ncbi:MAG TPA: substrate-binding domain-containing protein [Bryobacteraceae bacterium]|nr:substrate-binding domain-containing protein [Bryobacteraceae bacterium]